jgi:hypothetical protein
LDADKKIKRKRRFSAYGSLDKKQRQWRYLPSVTKPCGVKASGDELVYRVNNTTLEIGQGAGSFRGFLGVGALCAFGAMLYGTFIALFGISKTDFEELGFHFVILAVFMLVGSIFLTLLAGLFLLLDYTG